MHKFDKQILALIAFCIALFAFAFSLFSYQLEKVKETGGIKAEIMEIWEGKKE